MLDATSPDVLHVHNLLNLSFDLPRIARERGIPVVATLHDYTLVCPSGGQRVHVSESHVCETIDAERCARCFGESPFSRQMRAGSVTRGKSGRMLLGAGRMLHRVAPALALSAVRSIDGPPVTPPDIRRRLAYARHVFEAVDLFVAPSASMAREFVELGIPIGRIHVSDYGFRPPVAGPPPAQPGGPLRVGFVGTLVWHKGAHEGGRTIGRGSARRIYFGTRNHLRLTARTGHRSSRLVRLGLVAGFNAAYVLMSPESPLVAGVAAFLRGVRDHANGRYGAG